VAAVHLRFGECFGGLPVISDLSVYQMRQAPDSEPVLAVLEVHGIDLFRSVVLDPYPFFMGIEGGFDHGPGGKDKVKP